MGKKKLTLTIDEDIIKEVKALFVGRGIPISKIVEEFLESTLISRWLEDLGKALGYENLLPLDPSRIPEERPRGLYAAKIVRELRDERYNL